MVAGSAAAAVRDASVVITMLPTAEVVGSVIFDDGVADAFSEAAVWAQMGTIGQAATAEFAARLGREPPGRDVRGRAGVRQQGTRRAGAIAHPRVGPARRRKR